MRCVLIQNGVESPLGRRAGVTVARPANPTVAYVPVRPIRIQSSFFCGQLRVAHSGRLLRAACRSGTVFWGRASGVSRSPARSTDACVRPLICLSSFGKGIRGTRYCQVNDLRRHVSIPWLNHLCGSGSRKDNQHKHEVFRHTSISYRIARRTQFNGLPRQTVMLPRAMLPNGLTGLREDPLHHRIAAFPSTSMLRIAHSCCINA